MDETFPHLYEDGYVVTNGLSTGWKSIYYEGIYRNTNAAPYQWNKYSKKKKPVSAFVTSMWRGNRVDEKRIWYGCDCIYRYSAN